MSYNTNKPTRIIDDLVEALAYYGLASAVTYDVNNDAIITVTDVGPLKGDAVIKVLDIEQTAPNIANPITGLATPVWTPHLIRVGFGRRTAAFQLLTIAGVLATDAVVINGVTFTAVAGAPAADQFQVDASDEVMALRLITAINASASAGVVDTITASHVAGGIILLVADATGTGGNAYTLSTPDAPRFAVGGATFASGDDTETSLLTRLRILSEVFPKGTEVEVYEVQQYFTDAAFVAANLVATFRNQRWGNLVHI